jgi:predicted phage-related endonuclease
MTATIGGTMVSRILGLSRWGGPLSAYYELTGEASPEDAKLAHQARGNTLEQSVLQMWSERSGIRWTPWEAVRSEAMPHAHASLDALGLLGPGAGGVIPDAKTLSREAMGEDWGLDGTDQIPVEYHLQLLWYLGVCKAAGMRVADEALLPTLVGPEAELQWAARLVTATGRPLALADLDGTGLELRVYRVAWDALLFEQVNARVLEFLQKHVAPRKPPEPAGGDMPERDARAVSRGVKAEPGRVLDFDQMQPAEQALLTDLLDCARERREWERLEAQAELRTKLVMGTADEVRGLPGGARVTWRARADGVRVFKVAEPRGRR